MKNKEIYLELLIYMVTSAAGLENEPHIYGSVRMIEATQKLCRLMQKDDSENAELKELIEIIENGKQKWNSDEEGFRRMLQDAAAKLLDFI